MNDQPTAADVFADGAGLVTHGRTAQHVQGSCVTSSMPNVSGRMVEVAPDVATYDVRSFQSFYGRLHTEEEIANNPAAKLRHPKIGDPPASVAIATIRSWPQ